MNEQQQKLKEVFEDAFNATMNINKDHKQQKNALNKAMQSFEAASVPGINNKHINKGMSSALKACETLDKETTKKLDVVMADLYQALVNIVVDVIVQ